MADNNENKENSGLTATATSKFAEYKGEFKRIIWPSKKVLYDNTKNSIVICLVFGVIIFALDFVFNYGMEMITRIVG